MSKKIKKKKMTTQKELEKEIEVLRGEKPNEYFERCAHLSEEELNKIGINKAGDCKNCFFQEECKIGEFREADEDELKEAKIKEAQLKGIKETKAKIIEDIKDMRNPYPKDVFRWDNKEKLNFNRGRFNRHCFEVIENFREEVLKEIENSNKK